MKIFDEVKILVGKEKALTFEILKKLVVIEKDKLYADLKYPSLHKFLTRSLKYSDSEASVKVGAVRLMLKSTNVAKKIEKGELSLSNAAEASKVLKGKSDPRVIEKVIKDACDHTNRSFKEKMALEFGMKRREVLSLDEHMIKQFDRLRKKYGDLSTYELIQILLEKDLRAPAVKRQRQSVAVKNSRYIPKGVKVQVYKGKCENCGVKHGLEYHHKHKFSHGGTNLAANIGVLCRSCNQREEIKAVELNFFA